MRRKPVESGPRIRTPEEINKADALNNREQQVCDLMGLALGNKEIADKMSISIQTVKNYTHIIYIKTGLSRMEIVRNAAHKELAKTDDYTSAHSIL